QKHKATLNLLYTAYWLKTHISATLKDVGITAEQYNVMRILKGMHPEPMCVKNIGSRMIEKSSNVPRIIDRLVDKKLVKRTRSKEDKRETIMLLTDSGLQLLDDCTQKMEKVNEEILGLSEQESQMLNDLLERLRKKD